MATNDELRKRAVKRLKQKREFRNHLVSYVLINAAGRRLGRDRRRLLLARLGDGWLGDRAGVQCLAHLRPP